MTTKLYCVIDGICNCDYNKTDECVYQPLTDEEQKRLQKEREDIIVAYGGNAKEFRKWVGQ